MKTIRHQLKKLEITPEAAWLNRREIVKKWGLGTIGAAGMATLSGVMPSMKAMANQDRDAIIKRVLKPAIDPESAKDLFPAKRNPKFKDYPAGAKQTEELVAATYNNFYEFTVDKRYVWITAEQSGFKCDPWTIEVTGLCNKPGKFSIDDLFKQFGKFQEERAYRFRCVEAWSMDVPWTGFELNKLLQAVEPKNEAKYVRFVTVKDEKHMPGMIREPNYPWPYYEGLRMDEAMHELTLLGTGIYGHPFPNQHGAPFRMIVPWKYGYKSIKSIVKIELVDKQPGTFWSKLIPDEYPFESNVNPQVPHPRWSQAAERVIPTGVERKTLPYNGYAEFVAKLYS